MERKLQTIYLTDMKTEIGASKPFVTGDELFHVGEILTLRPLVAPRNVSRETIEKIRLQEQSINGGEYTPEEKMQLLHQLKVNYFLELLNGGYGSSTIEEEIDNAVIGFKTAGVDLCDWICELEEQRAALNGAIISKSENTQQKR